MDHSRVLDGSDFFARQTIFTELYDLLMRSDSIAGETEYYEGFCRRHAPKYILDAACGSGRVSKALASPGRRVHAFDISPYFINRFRAELMKTPASGSIQIEQASFESFKSAQDFDLVIVGFYSLSYVLRRAERERAISNLADHIRRGGHMVLHLPDPNLLTREVPDRELDRLSFSRKLGTLERNGQPVDINLSQRIEAFSYDESRNLTEIRLRLSVTGEGEDLRVERQTMGMAPIEELEVKTMAQTSGLDIEAIDQGFVDHVRSERVYTMRKV